MSGPAQEQFEATMRQMMGGNEAELTKQFEKLAQMAGEAGMSKGWHKWLVKQVCLKTGTDGGWAGMLKSGRHRWWAGRYV